MFHVYDLITVMGEISTEVDVKLPLENLRPKES